MSAGLYVLRAARGRIRRRRTPRTSSTTSSPAAAGSAWTEHDRPVGPGTIIFVEAGVEHRFHSITSDLTVLVVFAPPEE